MTEASTKPNRNRLHNGSTDTKTAKTIDKIYLHNLKISHELKQKWDQ